jgi:hypothetical protein
MEFDVIDPKDHSFDDWIHKIETFLNSYPEYQDYSVNEGELYFTRDDIADPWGEESMMYVIPGESGGLIELRGVDRDIYLFAEEFAGRNLKDSKEGNQFQFKNPTAVYGFDHNSLGKSRFHKGPIKGVYFLHQGDLANHPQSTPAARLWGGVLSQAIQWIHNQVSRFQELKELNESEGPANTFELDVTFAHPASVGLVLEKIRFRQSIKERERKRIRIVLENPAFDTLRDLFDVMPCEDDQYETLKLKMVWGIEKPDGERSVVTYMGAERRFLKPLIHLPRQRCAKEFRERFREHFKGYRVDRQEYLLD